MSRESLSPARLDAFLRFLAARGCDSRPGNGQYEVVQVRLPDYDAWYPVYRRAKPANAWLSPDGRLDALLREFDLLPADPLNAIPDPDEKPAEMKSAGWTIRRAGHHIAIESPEGDGTGLSRTQGDLDVFRYFDALLRENGL